MSQFRVQLTGVATGVEKKRLPGIIQLSMKGNSFHLQPPKTKTTVFDSASGLNYNGAVLYPLDNRVRF